MRLKQLLLITLVILFIEHQKYISRLYTIKECKECSILTSLVKVVMAVSTGQACLMDMNLMGKNYWDQMSSKHQNIQ